MANSIPTVRFPEARPLWFTQFQDGPIWGLIEWPGVKFWYEYAGFEGAERLYDVFEIQADDVAQEEQWFARRRATVGGPCEFDAEGRVVVRPWSEDREAWMEINELDERRGDPPYHRNRKVARFAWSP